MYSKYIQQFLEDNDLQAGEKFYILGEDGEALIRVIMKELEYILKKQNL